MRFIVIKKKAVLVAVAVVLVSALLVSACVITGASAVFLGKSTKKLPVYCVETGEKKVAISFDAAWGADKTDGIIETLAEYGAGATFFLVGFWARKYPEKVAALDAAGIEIGTHSNSHPHMPKLSESQMRLELTASVESIREITGKEISLFRAPFGDYSDKMLNVCESLSLKTIQWDVDSLDWKDLKPQEMAERVLSRVKAGSIILFHNDGKYTPEALPVILLGLKNKGYTVTSVGDLLPADMSDCYIDHAGVLRKNGNGGG